MLCTIIGVGPGLGAALAHRFNAAGFSVAMVARNLERLEQVRADLPHPDEAACFPADAGREDELVAALEEVERWRGDTDVLVYNAAQMTPDRVPGLHRDELRRALDVDLGGAVTSLERLLPGMRARGSGVVLLTGGGLALEPYPDWATLGVGKAALRNLGLGLAKRLRPEGIQVTVVAVCGVIGDTGDTGPLSPAAIAEVYHDLAVHGGPREVVYLPDGADPYYNDPEGTYRADSQPIRSTT